MICAITAGPAAPLIYMACRGGGVDMNHPGDREGNRGEREPESKYGRSSNAAHSVTGTAHPAERRLVTKDTASVPDEKQVGLHMQGNVCQQNT